MICSFNNKALLYLLKFLIRSDIAFFENKQYLLFE